MAPTLIVELHVDAGGALKQDSTSSMLQKRVSAQAKRIGQGSGCRMLTPVTC